jgi:hypothetical protein
MGRQAARVLVFIAGVVVSAGLQAALFLLQEKMDAPPPVPRPVAASWRAA